MIVDDDPGMLEATSMLLAVKGYAVTSCASAEEALGEFDEGRVDVVLSDLRMPGASGAELLERLHDKSPRIPVILTTGYADLNAAVDAISRGAFDFIIKPASPEYLLHSIKKACQHNRYLQIKEDYKHYLEDMVEQRTLDLEKEISERKQAEQALMRSREMFRLLSRRLQTLEDNERKTLARELHDRVGQSLTGLGISINIVRAQLSGESLERVSSRLDDAMNLLEQIAGDIRDIMAELRPEVLDDYGLVAAMRWYCEQFSRRTGITASVKAQIMSIRMSAHIENALFRICQEAMNNAAKHSGADMITISFIRTDSTFRTTVEDNGKGFTPGGRYDSGKQGGWGIITMQERAEDIHGIFRIDSATGKGTRITVEIDE